MVTSTSYGSQPLLFNFKCWEISRFWFYYTVLLGTFRRTANNQDHRIEGAYSVLTVQLAHANHSCNPVFSSVAVSQRSHHATVWHGVSANCLAPTGKGIVNALKFLVTSWRRQFIWQCLLSTVKLNSVQGPRSTSSPPLVSHPGTFQFYMTHS